MGKNRAQQLYSCGELVASANCPLQLQEAAINGTNSLINVVGGMTTSFFALLKRYDQFPDVGACGFNPQRIDIANAETIEGLHRQIFGEECDEVSSASYVAERSTLEKKLIKIQVAAAEKMFSINQGAISPHEGLAFAEELEHDAEMMGEVSMEDVKHALDEESAHGGSLVQLSVDQGTAASAVKILLWILLIIFTGGLGLIIMIVALILWGTSIFD